MQLESIVLWYPLKLTERVFLAPHTHTYIYNTLEQKIALGRWRNVGKWKTFLVRKIKTNPGKRVSVRKNEMSSFVWWRGKCIEWCIDWNVDNQTPNLITLVTVTGFRSTWRKLRKLLLYLLWPSSFPLIFAYLLDCGKCMHVPQIHRVCLTQFCKS